MLVALQRRTTDPKQHKLTRMGCGSVVQNPGPLGLFDAHAGNEPSALHVQNQVQPFPPTYPYSLSFLLFSMNTPLSNPLLQSPFHQSPCNNMCQILPSLHGPAQETSSPITLFKPQSTFFAVYHPCTPPIIIIMAICIPICPLLFSGCACLCVSMLPGAQQALRLLVSLTRIEWLGPGLLPPVNSSFFTGKEVKPLARTQGCRIKGPPLLF